MKNMQVALITALFVAASAAPGFAQMGPGGEPSTGPHGAYIANCGAWMNGVWVSNGSCHNDPYAGRADIVSGTITSVKGHLVTVQRSQDSVVINDRPALNNQNTGRVAVGRQIVAHGFWRDGTFFATAIT
jgi:hypothetical protein